MNGSRVLLRRGLEPDPESRQTEVPEKEGDVVRFSYQFPVYKGQTPESPTWSRSSDT